MGESQQTNIGDTTKRRTRKSDIISGVTVVLSVPLLTLAWNIFRDLQSNTKAKDDHLNQRIESVKQYCESTVESERQRAQEQERDLKAELRELRTILLTRGRR